MERDPSRDLQRNAGFGDGLGIRIRLGQRDLGDQLVFAAEEPVFVAMRQVLDVDGAVQLKVGDIDIDVAGDVVRQAFDLDLVENLR